MATEGVVPSAKAISAAFVEQYYYVLSQLPHEAYKLYVADSVFSRPSPDGTMLSFTSVEAINEHILSCGFENTTFEVLSIDSQNALDDGIIIMVIGFMTGKDNLRRKFSQIFYLARHNNHVVLNDMFRYVDQDDSTPQTLPVVECEPATEIVKPAAELKKTELKQKNDASVAKSVNVAVEKNAAAPLDNGKMKQSEKAVIAQKPTEQVAETVAPQPDGAKRSFAAIVQSLANNAAPFQVKAPVQQPKYMGQPRAAAAPKKPAYVSKSIKKNDQKIIEEPGKSIFVANLPLNAMPPQLYELFKDFGPIKENGIQVRSSRGNANPVCFGFIAFESAASVQSVLQATKNTPFMLADRKLRVKEKEVDYDGSKPSGKTKGGSNKTQNGSADGSKSENSSADDSKTQNGSAEDGEDEFKQVRSRRNSRKNRNANGDNNQKKSEGGAPKVQAA
ncbi:RNA recognition motif domain [Arabidopsis suecica]|uniref:RNA recognition motif domain n=1 Tax=Arabidopsis suecica TaxID=45249 RepID=A0A8T2BRH6_ARASU|nr:RNA recognition motif domain [Arabidopsis suecica]